MVAMLEIAFLIVCVGLGFWWYSRTNFHRARRGSSRPSPAFKDAVADYRQHTHRGILTSRELHGQRHVRSLRQAQRARDSDVTVSPLAPVAIDGDHGDSDGDHGNPEARCADAGDEQSCRSE